MNRINIRIKQNIEKKEFSINDYNSILNFNDEYEFNFDEFEWKENFGINSFVLDTQYRYTVLIRIKDILFFGDYQMLKNEYHEMFIHVFESRIQTEEEKGFSANKILHKYIHGEDSNWRKVK